MKVDIEQCLFVSRKIIVEHQDAGPIIMNAATSVWGWALMHAFQKRAEAPSELTPRLRILGIIPPEAVDEYEPEYA